jgi:uncharacterized protein YlbG (UPF0298 family)
MARARNIKPAFFLNTDLSETHPLARLSFIGLWTIADYKGCIECNFKKIKAQVLPYDDCDFESLMNNLEQFRFIRYYSVQGKRYIKIENFEKHQNPHKNERDSGSNIPDITENDNSFNELKQDGTTLDNNGTTRADSLLLIPDTLNPIPAKKTKSKKNLDYDDHPEFLEFWNVYPNKDGKYKALEIWVEIKPPIDKVLHTLSWQKKTVKWNEKEGTFIPMPSTYLNQKRWEDEPSLHSMENPF